LFAHDLPGGGSSGWKSGLAHVRWNVLFLTIAIWITDGWPVLKALQPSKSSESFSSFSKNVAKYIAALPRNAASKQLNGGTIDPSQPMMAAVAAPQPHVTWNCGVGQRGAWALRVQKYIAPQPAKPATRCGNMDAIHAPNPPARHNPNHSLNLSNLIFPLLILGLFVRTNILTIAYYTILVNR